MFIERHLSNGDAEFWQWRSDLIRFKDFFSTGEGDDANTSLSSTSWMWQGY
jgi:hypothetical protein